MLNLTSVVTGCLWLVCCQGDVDDKQAAVKMKMFGKLTRETFEWHPDKLLCQRFNVPNPYPG